MSQLSADEVIRLLDLEPLEPEGGYYRRTYVSGFMYRPSGPKVVGDRIDDENDESETDGSGIGHRAIGSAIYYLMTRDSFSSLHRLEMDEIWHFYAGAPVRIHLFPDRDPYRCRLLGNDLVNEERPQYLVPAGTWFGATLERGEWALVGCTLSPGFRPDGFTLPSPDDLQTLCRRNPKEEQLLLRLSE